MGYVLFAMQKILLCGRRNAAQAQQMCLMDCQMKNSNEKSILQQEINVLEGCCAKEQAELYTRLAEGNCSETEKNQIEAKIKSNEAKTKSETSCCNRQLQQLAAKDNMFDLQIKRLDTTVSVLTQMLEAVQQAEAQAIKDCTPKLAGLG